MIRIYGYICFQILGNVESLCLLTATSLIHTGGCDPKDRNFFIRITYKLKHIKHIDNILIIGYTRKHIILVCNICNETDWTSGGFEAWLIRASKPFFMI